MNRTLFLSIHGIASALVLAAAASLVVLTPFGGGNAGRPGDGDKLMLFATGWAALVGYAIAYAYVLRKYAHRAGYSPEFRWQLPRARIERAEKRLDELRYLAAQGGIVGGRELLRRARVVLREEGCERVLRVSIGGASGAVELVTARTEPLGRVARWLHAHVYYGFAASALALVHGGARWSTPMGVVLNGLVIVVLVTGLVGIVLWTFGPAWLTREERDLSIEEAFVLERHYARRLAEGTLALLAPAGTLPPPESASPFGPAAARERLERASVERARAAALSVGGDVDDALWGRSTPDRARFEDARARLADAAYASARKDDGVDDAELRRTASARAAGVLTLAGQRRRVRGELARLARVRTAMNAWRLAHVPASIVLLAVIVLHVVSVWVY